MFTRYCQENFSVERFLNLFVEIKLFIFLYVVDSYGSLYILSKFSNFFA